MPIRSTLKISEFGPFEMEKNGKEAISEYLERHWKDITVKLQMERNYTVKSLKK